LGDEICEGLKRLFLLNFEREVTVRVSFYLRRGMGL